jgi:2-hydroxy-6-oxonona-2,4-dienedioate hydrolase
METLTLNNNDPKVIAARNAERQLFDFYGLNPEDHYILLTDPVIKIRISVFGTGEPIVIVPGNTGDVFPLASLLAQFKNRRIIAINSPGGGLSEGLDHTTVDIHWFAVATLEAVLDAFELQSVDIIAHSIGAHWSLWLAMDRPKRVRKLVLLGNPGNVMKGKPPILVRLFSKPPFNKFLFWLLVPSSKDKALHTLKSMGHSDETIKKLPEALKDCYYYFRLLPHYQISTLSLLENAAPQIDALQLGTVCQPVLFILGTNDTFASIAVGEDIAAALPHAAFHPISGAGHLPWLENPENCGRLIMDFLANK